VCGEEAGDLPARRPRRGSRCELENFSGPFDLLLGLISKRRLDVTEIALAEVTDEFIAYTTELKDQANLAEISQFLLVAATLLDLKTARLLPHEEGEEVLDLELLEASDLLFARLLQYKAYKSVSGYLAEAMAAGSIRAPRDVDLEPEFQDVLPPLELNIGPGELAGIFATVLQRDHTPPSVAVDHIHLPLVSVSEQRGHILSLLRAGDVDFQDLLESRREHPGRRGEVPRPARTVQGRPLRLRPARASWDGCSSTAPR
jgi:segregation and condensation protein A